MEERARRTVLCEVVVGLNDGEPVGHVQQRCLGIGDDLRSLEEREGDHVENARADDHGDRRGEQSTNASRVEPSEANRARAIKFGQECIADDEAGEDEEQVDTDEAGAQYVDVGVVPDDQDHSNGA